MAENIKLFCSTSKHSSDVFSIDMVNLKEIAPGVWLYKNFLPEDVAQYMLDLVENVTDDQWDNEHFNLEPNDHFYDFWHSRTSVQIWPFEKLHAVTSAFFAPEYWITGAFRFFCRFQTKDILPTQAEIENRNIRNNHYNFFSKWRLGIYIGNFTGGEVVFPDFNNFTVAVGPRDMLIWKSNYQFTVNKVTSGTRYSYSDFLIDPFDHFFA